MNSHHNTLVTYLLVRLQSALVDLVNVLLAASCCKEINTIVFAGRLIAITKMAESVRSRSGTP